MNKRFRRRTKASCALPLSSMHESSFLFDLHADASSLLLPRLAAKIEPDFLRPLKSSPCPFSLPLHFRTFPRNAQPFRPTSKRPAMSRNSAGPPFPCPPGMAWDGRRFYKLDPKLAKVRESPASRGSSPDTAPALPPEHESGTTPSSAFHFTPANPPAAFSRAQDGGVYAMPRSGPPCSATSRAYKR